MKHAVKKKVSELPQTLEFPLSCCFGWSQTEQGCLHQKLSSTMKKRTANDALNFSCPNESLFLAIKSIFLNQSFLQPVVQSILPTGSLRLQTFPWLSYPSPPFKHDSNSSTQVLSTLLILLPLLHSLPPFLKGCEKLCGMLIVSAQSPIRFLITQGCPEVVNVSVNQPFRA